MNKNEAIYSVMLGHAVADALGVPAEFRSRQMLRANPITDTVGYGTHGQPAGTFSDDTSMSIAALDSLADGKLDYTEIMNNFCDWCYGAKYTATDVTFDIGGSCYGAISEYRMNGGNPTLCGRSGANENGNGSLMRIHPFALYLYYTKGERPEEYTDSLVIIHNASRLTHAHSRSLIGCGIYSFILWELLRSPEKESIRRGLAGARAFYRGQSELSHYERLFTKIANVCNTPIPDSEISGSGYVVHSLEAAVWCLLTTESYAECVLKAVNLGEDTDTVAAIAGGLAGALYGSRAIPEKWLNALLRRNVIEEMCKRAGENW